MDARERLKDSAAKLKITEEELINRLLDWENQVGCCPNCYERLLELANKRKESGR